MTGGTIEHGKSLRLGKGNDCGKFMSLQASINGPVNGFSGNDDSISGLIVQSAKTLLT